MEYLCAHCGQSVPERMHRRIREQMKKGKAKFYCCWEHWNLTRLKSEEHKKAVKASIDHRCHEKRKAKGLPAYSRAYQKRHISQGLCKICPKTAVRRNLCQRHLDCVLNYTREYIKRPEEFKKRKETKVRCYAKKVAGPMWQEFMLIQQINHVIEEKRND